MTFEFRAPAEEDRHAVAELCNAFQRAVAAEPELVNGDDLLLWWRRESEARLVLDGETLVGFAYLQRREGRWDGDGWVHPDAFGRGVGTAIAEWIEQRARALGSPEARIDILQTDKRAACLLRGRGFEPIRSFYRMRVDLDEEPPGPTWPEGFAVAVLGTGEERDLYQLYEDAFVDHWEHKKSTYEEWLRMQMLEHEFTFLVRAGAELAAAAACKRELFGMGWVNVLCTRQQYRRLGLGAALLRHSIRELHARGARRVGLGVDSENLTGATRLYERVGMRVVSASDLYSKSL